MRIKALQFPPAQILVLGFSALIFLGAFLLNLPAASQAGNPVGFINALFTSTSAVCVTGLVVVNTTQHWTVFGQLVIVTLIQIGGLGFMLFVTSLFLLIGKKINLSERILIQESLNQTRLQGIVLLVKHVLIGTFMIEGVCALILAIRFSYDLPMGTAMYWGIFHAISAFCNAGFDLTGNSMVPYAVDPIVNTVIMFLIVIGGIGFGVWIDLKESMKKFKQYKTHRRYHLQKVPRIWRELTLHSKLVLSITAFLIFGGFLFFLVVEYNNPNTLGKLPLAGKVYAALFQSVSPRTAGFNSIDLASMGNGSILMTIILMFIGGSPGATAGGIKTVTAGVIMLAVISVLRGKSHVQAYQKKIPMDLVLRSLTVAVLGFLVVCISTLLLSLTDPQARFVDILFESTSAFATVGLSLGLTAKLSAAGKIILSLAMFLGRLGPITTALALMQLQDKYKDKISYPEERILVG